MYFEIRASKTLTASQSFNENPCEVISFKDVSNSFPVQVSPDYIVIMPGFAFLILNVAKSLTSDGLVLVAGGREVRRPKFNCDWLASEWCSQCILWVRGGSNLKMSRWQWMLTMEPSSSSSSLLQILFQTIPYFSKAEELILFANFYEIHLDPVSLSEICIH